MKTNNAEHKRIIYAGVSDLEASVGSTIGTSAWHQVTQSEVDKFAEATHDHQWIHTHVSRAQESYFGGTIVHGYMTLALASYLTDSVYRVSGLSMQLNYGANSVRYPAPLKTGSRIFARVELLSVTVADNGYKVVTRSTIMPERGTRPVCVAEIITLMIE